MTGNIVSTQADALRAFFARVRPYYRELFNMAHAICGNYELAEYAVQSAILDIFRRGTPRSRAGLRENLRARVRAMAVEQARLIDDAELTWDGFREDAIEGAEGDAVLQAASLEPLENRRMLMLRYGCGLSAHDIARLLDMPAAQVSGVLTRFSRRLKRRLPPREHARVERAIVHSARGWLEKQNGGMPDAGAVYRSLEAELMEAGGSTHRVSRVLGRVLAIAVALLLAALFWLFMVLLQPPRLEEPAAVPTVAATPSAAPAEDFSAVEETVEIEW